MSADVLDFLRPLLASQKAMAGTVRDLSEVRTAHAELQERAAAYHRCMMLAISGLCLGTLSERMDVMDKVLEELRQVNARYSGGDNVRS